MHRTEASASRPNCQGGRCRPVRSAGPASCCSGVRRRWRDTAFASLRRSCPWEPVVSRPRRRSIEMPRDPRIEWARSARILDPPLSIAHAGGVCNWLPAGGVRVRVLQRSEGREGVTEEAEWRKPAMRRDRDGAAGRRDSDPPARAATDDDSGGAGSRWKRGSAGAAGRCRNRDNRRAARRSAAWRGDGSGGDGGAGGGRLDWWKADRPEAGRLLDGSPASQRLTSLAEGVFGEGTVCSQQAAPRLRHGLWEDGPPRGVAVVTGGQAVYPAGRERPAAWPSRQFRQAMHRQRPHARPRVVASAAAPSLPSSSASPPPKSSPPLHPWRRYGSRLPAKF
jgi:hypothetical protein